MTNGLVNGTPSLEGKFGGYHTFTATRTLTLILTHSQRLSVLVRLLMSHLISGNSVLPLLLLLQPMGQFTPASPFPRVSLTYRLSFPQKRLERFPPYDPIQ